MLSAMVTALPVPASLSAKLPLCVSTNTSAPCTPTKVPPLTLAVVVASYTLLATMVLLTVRSRWLMLAVMPMLVGST